MIWPKLRDFWLWLTGHPGETQDIVLLTSTETRGRKGNASRHRDPREKFSAWEWLYISGDDVFVMVEHLGKELLRHEAMESKITPLYLGQPLVLKRAAGGLDVVRFKAGGARYALNRMATVAPRDALLHEHMCIWRIHRRRGCYAGSLFGLARRAPT